MDLMEPSTYYAKMVLTAQAVTFVIGYIDKISPHILPPLYVALLKKNRQTTLKPYTILLVRQ